MSYDFFSMNTICENAVLHHRLFYCVSELFRVPGNHKRPQLSRPAQLLHELGMPSSLSGYRFLEFAMTMLAKQPHLLKNLDRGLYPMIAEKFDSTNGRVEKNIRCAIERAWLRGNPTLIREIFGYSVNPDQGRPFNAEFLCAVCDYLNR